MESEFFNRTASQFTILACRAGSEDCSDQVSKNRCKLIQQKRVVNCTTLKFWNYISDKWKDELHQEGLCKHYEPRKGISLNIVIIYNVSDWVRYLTVKNLNKIFLRALVGHIFSMV